MTSHQVLVSASMHDAVTNDALALRDVLSRTGRSQIYAHHVDPRLGHEVRSLHEFPAAPGGPIVFHGSIGDPDVLRFLRGRPEPIVLVYHNVTPAGYFLPYDPDFASLLTLGRTQLALLRDRVCLALADSGYNAEELRALGYDDVQVAPLVFDVEPRGPEHDDPWTTGRLRASQGPLVLFVGQLLPHKRPDLLVQAFHVLRTYLHGSARLMMVGPARLPGFRRALGQFARELNPPDLEFAGPVEDAALAACYRNADVFVTASEHEGFCIPLVEAMAYDLPVVARACAAVPDTLGGAGIEVPADAGPALLAEALYEVLDDPGLRDALVERGRHRRRAFDPREARATLERRLSAVL